MWISRLDINAYRIFSDRFEKLNTFRDQPVTSFSRKNSHFRVNLPSYRRNWGKISTSLDLCRKVPSFEKKSFGL